MENLSLHDGEEIEFVDEGEAEVEATQSLCLVGRFLTDRNIRVPIMKDRLADVWRPGAWSLDRRSGARALCVPVLPSVGYSKGAEKWSVVVR